MQYRGVAGIDSARDDDRRQAPSIPSPMPQFSACQMPSEITQKWRALAIQRHAHFVELQQTGRWKHYYSEHDFLIRMREAVHLLELWNTLMIPGTKEKRAGTA
jgi:hypothetical protein